MSENLQANPGKRVVLATIALHKMAGGLERNIVRIANYLKRRGHDVSILTFDLPDAESFYPIADGIAWHKTGRTEPHRAIGFADRLELLKRIRQALKGEPTVIVFHHGLLPRLMLAGAGLKKRLIVTERNALSMYRHIRAGKWNPGFFLMLFVSKIVVQFESYKKNYPASMRQKIRAIPNAVEKVSRQAMTDAPDANGRFKVLAVGRLCDQKNHAALIAAFANLAAGFADWDLEIAGEGHLEKILKAQARESGLSPRIIFSAAGGDIERKYLQSHLYAMPSKWEGFPNALAEALAHGLPCIGYTGCDGVADLIRHGENGYLAEGNGDIDTLTVALEKMMSGIEIRKKMGQAAPASVAGYAEGFIYPQWEELL